MIHTGECKSYHLHAGNAFIQLRVLIKGIFSLSEKRTGFLSIESGLRDFGKSASDMIVRKLSFVVNRKEK